MGTEVKTDHHLEQLAFLTTSLEERNGKNLCLSARRGPCLACNRCQLIFDKRLRTLVSMFLYESHPVYGRIPPVSEKPLASIIHSNIEETFRPFPQLTLTEACGSVSIIANLQQQL